MHFCHAAWACHPAVWHARFLLQDYEKQRWCEEVEKSDSQIIYFSGRLIPEKERSAKAGMLNFCLGKIYPDQATARAVGFTELICVFKSDQVNMGVEAS